MRLILSFVLEFLGVCASYHLQDCHIQLVAMTVLQPERPPKSDLKINNGRAKASFCWVRLSLV